MSDDAKFLRKVTIVNLMLNGASASSLSPSYGETPRTLNSWMKSVDEKGKKNVVYEISLVNSGLDENDSFTVRILNPYEKSVVYGYKNGSWTELESKVRGQYLQVEMTGVQEYFCVVEQSSNLTAILSIAAGAAVVSIVLIILARMVRAGKRKRKKKIYGIG